MPFLQQQLSTLRAVSVGSKDSVPGSVRLSGAGNIHVEKKKTRVVLYVMETTKN